MPCWLCAWRMLLRCQPARSLVGCKRPARRARACGRPVQEWRPRACGRPVWPGLRWRQGPGRPSHRRLGGWTRCRRSRRGLGARLPRRPLRGRGRLDGLGTGVRSRCRWTARPTTANQPVAYPTVRRTHPCRPGQAHQVWCSWAARLAERTAAWLGATGCYRPRMATRCRRPWAHSPRTGTRRCAVRSAVVRAVRVVWIPRAEWTGCRNATSGRPLGSPSSGVCTGRCRTRTLFRCSLQSRAPTTFLVVEVALTSRLAGAPQERPAT